MMVPNGYIIFKEEVEGSCLGCAFDKNPCKHPHKRAEIIGCDAGYIFKKENKSFRSKLTKLINKMGLDGKHGIPDFALANHMIDSMNSLSRTTKIIKLH